MGCTRYDGTTIVVCAGTVQCCGTYYCDNFYQADVRHHLDDLCDPTLSLDEDSCLNTCLVDKFVKLAGCVHPRLKVTIKQLALRRNSTRICHYGDLSNLITRNVLPRRTDSKGNEIDPGEKTLTLNNVGYNLK